MERFAVMPDAASQKGLIFGECTPCNGLNPQALQFFNVVVLATWNKTVLVGSGDHKTECMWACMSNVSSFSDRMLCAVGKATLKEKLLSMTLEGGVSVAMLREQSFQEFLLAKKENHV